GGRTPEPIPEVGPDGSIVGWRRRPGGEPITTELTPEGERQLEQIAAASPDGRLGRAATGMTGIDEITEMLKGQMKGWQSERVVEVYAAVYVYPLGLALLLLLIEAFLPEAPRRRFSRPAPAVKKPRLAMSRRPLAEGPRG